jgi:hypothetical protein
VNGIQEIPESVWRAEPRHKGIWKSAGPCVRCMAKPRESMCQRCGEPMCAACLKTHGKDHVRDLYIERLANGTASNGTREEEAEAAALRTKWADE